MHRSRPGGAGICGPKGSRGLGDGDGAHGGSGTRRAEWNGGCASFGGGAAAGDVCGVSGRH